MVQAGLTGCHEPSRDHPEGSYFRNNPAATLEEVLNHYDAFFEPTRSALTVRSHDDQKDAEHQHRDFSCREPHVAQ